MMSVMGLLFLQLKLKFVHKFTKIVNKLVQS